MKVLSFVNVIVNMLVVKFLKNTLYLKKLLFKSFIHILTFLFPGNISELRLILDVMI